MTTPTFVLNDEAAFDDLYNTISAKLGQIRGIAQAMDPDDEDDALWAIKDLASDCEDIAAELFHRLNGKVDLFHNTPVQDEGAQHH